MAVERPVTTEVFDEPERVVTINWWTGLLNGNWGQAVRVAGQCGLAEVHGTLGSNFNCHIRSSTGLAGFDPRATIRAGSWYQLSGGGGHHGVVLPELVGRLVLPIISTGDTTTNVTIVLTQIYWKQIR